MSMFIEDLIQQPEGKTLEFKRDLSSPKPLLKTLVAFANTAGGRLVIGVTDHKKIVGIAHPLDEEETLSNLIADSILPRLVPTVELVTIEEKTLLVVEVFLSNSRPHFFKKEGEEHGVYVRLGSTNRQADQALVAELHRTVDGVAFDEMPMAELSLDDLDLTAAQEAFEGIRKLNEQNLATLKLVTRYQNRWVPTKGGILLFGKERVKHFSDAWIQCGRFFGTTKLDIFDQAEIHSPLPQAVDEVMLFLKKHAYRTANLYEVRRKDMWSIPLGILREVVVNALVHSDYSQRGAPVRVVFLDDRIEVESMGILLPGLTIEEIKRGTSRIRNHVIVRIFRELNLIEQWGTGVCRIFEDAEAGGLPEPKIEEVGMRLRFTVFLKVLHPIDLGEPSVSVVKEGGLESGLLSELGAQSSMGAQSRALSEAQSRALSGLGAQSDAILLALSKKPLSASDLMKELKLESKSGAFKRTITGLLKEGLIERTIPEKPNSRLQKYRLVVKTQPLKYK